MPRIEYSTKVNGTDNVNTQLVKEGTQKMSEEMESETIMVEQDSISDTRSDSAKVNVLKVNLDST